jgi:hypothetical protein
MSTVKSSKKLSIWLHNNNIDALDKHSFISLDLAVTSFDLDKDIRVPTSRKLLKKFNNAGDEQFSMESIIM